MAHLIIGSDPEVFLKDQEGNTVSSIGIIPGSKRNPFNTLHGSVQPDNISAEFNSKPSSSREEFINNHKLIMKDLLDIVSPLGLSLDISASVMAKPKILKGKGALLAGCEPDANVWLKALNPPPILKGGLRAAGGHLHISFDQADTGGLKAREDFIKCCDLMLGVPSVVLDTDKRRRKLYGKAGSTRFKFVANDDPYNGAEYRTLSNFWLRSEELMGWAFDRVSLVYSNLNELTKVSEANKDSIISIINTGDAKAADTFMNKYNSLYVGAI